MVKTVKMVRDEDGKEADVHPDMVDEYKAGNFRISETEAPKPAGKKAKK